jgi:hypothetical protein
LYEKTITDTDMKKEIILIVFFTFISSINTITQANEVDKLPETIFKKEINKLFDTPKKYFQKRIDLGKKVSFSYIPCELNDEDIKQGFLSSCNSGFNYNERVSLRYSSDDKYPDLIVINMQKKIPLRLTTLLKKSFSESMKNHFLPEYNVFSEISFVKSYVYFDFYITKN